VADTTTSVQTEQLQNLYGADALTALTQEGQFWRAGRTDGFTITEQTGAGGKARGKAVIFDIYTAGTVSTTALGENTDGTATSLAEDQKTVTLVEHGDYVHTTRKLRETSYGSPEQQAAWMMGDLAQRTMDTLARDALDSETGATWVGYGGAGSTDATSVATITKGNEIAGDDVRKAFAKLRGKNVKKMADGTYWAFIHPDVFKDLKDETGDTSFVKAVQYSAFADNMAPIMDDVGIYEGFRFIQTTNAKLQSKAGNGTTTSAASADVYTTYFLGRDALGFGFYNESGDPLEIIVGQPLAAGGNDAFRRFQTIAWYSLCGFSAIRADAQYKIYSSSSLGANGA